MFTSKQTIKGAIVRCIKSGPALRSVLCTVETELKVTQSALDVHMGCTPFVKD